MAHELGHNKGLLHMYCAGNESNTDPSYPWPYPNCRLATVDPTGYYGFDVYYAAWLLSPTVISNDPTALSPNQGFPLMGYKRPRWISPYEYCKLLVAYGINCSLQFPSTTQEPTIQAGIEEPVAYAKPKELRTVQQASEYIVAGGLITTTNNTATFNGVYRITYPFTDTLQQVAARTDYRHIFEPQAGQAVTYTLVQADAIGQALDSREISLGVQDGDGSVQPFLELVPMVTGTARIQVRQGTSVLAERIASSNPPTVTLLSPNGGEQLGPGATVRWTASDPDGTN